MKTERRIEVTQAGRGGNGKLLLNGYRVSVWDDERILEIDNGDGYTTLLTYI